jgi:transcription elongation factor Elf1
MTTIKEKILDTTCPKCNLWQTAIYRMDFGYISSCKVCGTSLNKEAK